MNVLRTIRNNWKKSVFFSCIVGYGVSTISTNIQIKRYMTDLSTDVLRSSQSSGNTPLNVLVVMNPIANKKKAENLFKKYCEPILHLAGLSVEVLRTNHIGHAKTYVEELSALPDVIVVAGGDGTKSEVITGLLRRQGKSCPIAFLKFKSFSLTRNNELDYVKAMSNALIPLLKNQFKYESVIKYDVLSDPTDEGNVSNLKPIFGLSKFSWGLLKDIDTMKDKYWYLGPLKHHIAAFFKSFSSSSDWDLETEYVYTPPCRGCSNCCVQKEATPSTGFFLTKLVKPQNNSNDAKQMQIRNDDCATELHGKITSNQINISLGENEDNFTVLKSEFIDSLQPGWEFIKNIPNITNRTIEPNFKLKSRTIKLYPSASTPNTLYSIDGEEYDPRPIKVTIVPNAIKVFC
ncbi:acylglycerol kinase, mitochondrial isoform X1 [Drosophila grimshawi]|uniref:acylglycerol kinase, mitochondrial isoform X1 n=1 Tax=Drosophila grimshawi TaxID=7222 RepID=UPI001C931E33|nr:acylglycerol kinase, mitochondrial isoform X1 [Drosophila grimshawi]